MRSLSSKLLLDLKEARERLNQTSRNSSLPPSREAPWDKTRAADADAERDENPEETVAEDTPAEAARDAEAEAESAPAVESQPMARKRAGKVPGTPGHGRPAPTRVDAVEIHRPEACAGPARAAAVCAPAGGRVGVGAGGAHRRDPEAAGAEGVGGAGRHGSATKVGSPPGGPGGVASPKWASPKWASPKWASPKWASHDRRRRTRCREGGGAPGEQRGHAPHRNGAASRTHHRARESVHRFDHRSNNRGTNLDIGCLTEWRP